MPIKKATLVEKLVAEIRSGITSGRLVMGQSLPSEAKLAAQFGVSRPLLREALAELRAEGFLETVSGRGDHRPAADRDGPRRRFQPATNAQGARRRADGRPPL